MVVMEAIMKKLFWGIRDDMDCGDVDDRDSNNNNSLISSLNYTTA